MNQYVFIEKHNKYKIGVINTMLDYFFYLPAEVFSNLCPQFVYAERITCIVLR